jgi:ubiquinone biosynthesis monooxygenase Coq7
MGLVDRFILDIDKALRVVSGVVQSHRSNPAAALAEATLSDAEKRHSAALMRINHVGEVCAQALYDSQGRFSRSPEVKAQFAEASMEEEDHLAWTQERLRELGSRISLLNPVWYAGSYVLGTLAARAGDPYNLGFVSETEKQVEHHLISHLEQLPAQDAKSRAIVDQMRVDEIQHGQAARDLGGVDMPAPVKVAMRGMSKVMTTVAYYI